MKKIIFCLVAILICSLAFARDSSSARWSVEDILDPGHEGIFCEVYDSDLRFSVLPCEDGPGKIAFAFAVGEGMTVWDITRVFFGEAAFSLKATSGGRDLELMISRVPGHRGGLVSVLDRLRGLRRTETDVFQAEVKVSGEEAMEAFCVGVKTVSR